MKFEIERDEKDGLVRFHGEVTLGEIARLRLDPFERRQLNEKAENAADHLLDLELIFRRHMEQNTPPATEGAAHD